MNYKERYKKALERARAIYQGKYKPEIAAILAETLQSIFPELAESEDERIRKAIIEHLRQDIELEQILSEEVGSDWIAWLEKQGEQNLANSAKICKEDEEDWSEKDEKFVVDTMNFLYRAKKEYAQTSRLEECIDWLKSLKEKLVVK